jgi:hypothetical protein
MTIEYSIEFNTPELLLVLGNFGPCIVMGVEDPYIGMLSDEVKTMQHSALESLLMRGIVSSVSENEIEFEDHVSTIADVIYQPKHSLIVHSKSMTNSDFHCYIHFANEWIVQHSPLGDHHQLTLTQKVENLSEYLDLPLHASSKSESSSPTFSLAEEVLFEVRSLCALGDLNSARDRLKAAHLFSDAIDPLINTLNRPVATSSFVLIVNRNNVESQYVRGFSVLEGGDEMWIMEPFEKEGAAMVTFLAANAKKVRERFFDTLPKK